MNQLSDDKARLDVARVHRWRASSYWSPGIARVLVENAIAGSHIVAAYWAGGHVGYARMATDHATFTWLADVWVEGLARGQGLGPRMVQWFIDHPDFQGIRRMALASDVHGACKGLGFHPLIPPERCLERLDADGAPMLRPSP